MTIHPMPFTCLLPFTPEIGASDAKRWSLAQGLAILATRNSSLKKGERYHFPSVPVTFATFGFDAAARVSRTKCA